MMYLYVAVMYVHMDVCGCVWVGVGVDIFKNINKLKDCD